MQPICDSHAHLYFPKLQDRHEELLRSAAEAGVMLIVNIGTEPETNRVAVEQAATLGRLADGSADPALPRLAATVGFHPHEAAKIVEADWPVIRELAGRSEVVALGEFGLDFHYDHSPRDVQRQVLRRGIELAVELGMPMVIHSRQCGLEVIEALDEVAGPGSMPRGVFHCFTDEWAVAEAALERGFYIGITGIVTFPNADNVREVARRIPLERLLVETDAPFCAPIPMRGKTNEPAFVGYVCDYLAQLQGRQVSDVRRQTRINTLQLYGLEDLDQGGD